MMVSRVRKGVIGGILSVGVGVSGVLVGCAHSDSSESVSEGVRGESNTPSSSSSRGSKLSDEIEVSLNAHSLNGKKNDDDDKNAFVGITGTIKNKTSKNIKLSTLDETYYFNCQPEPDPNLVNARVPDKKTVCGKDADISITLPPHGTYKNAMMTYDPYVFDPDTYSGGTDDFRIKGGKKQFSIRFDSKDTADPFKVWVTMTGV